MQHDAVLLGHGGGGRLTHELIEEVFVGLFDNEHLAELADSARLPTPPSGFRPALPTDAYVVSPRIFPGGDIGRLSVCGTVNDLAVVGAEPKYLTCAFVLEEGLALAELETIARSMAQAAREAGVLLVAGDTKVVPKGKADGIFVTTAGLGWIPEGRDLGAHRIAAGDAVIVSGTIGDHGTTILAAREGLGLTTDLTSDVAPLWRPIKRLFEAGISVHALRDPTRGGVAQTLVELAQQARLRIRIREADLPVRGSVRAVCDLLGLDVLQVANEGKFVAFVPEEEAGRALEVLRQDSLCQDASIVGRVEDAPPMVVLDTAVGGSRVVEPPTGELLPRIC